MMKSIYLAFALLVCGGAYAQTDSLTDPSAMLTAPEQWTMNSYLKKNRTSGEYVETFYTPVYYTFHADGTYDYSVEGMEPVYHGSWSYDKATSLLKLTDTNNPAYTREYKVRELTDKKLILLNGWDTPEDGIITFQSS